jgi:hypothetical protein
VSPRKKIAGPDWHISVIAGTPLPSKNLTNLTFLMQLADSSPESGVGLFKKT